MGSPRHAVKKPDRKPVPPPRPALRLIKGQGQTAPAQVGATPSKKPLTKASKSRSTASQTRTRRAPEAKKSQSAGMTFFVVSAIAIAAFVFGLVLLNVFLAQSSFRLADLQAETANQEALYRKMRFEVAKAESPSRVAEAATSMGLVVPDKQEYLIGRPEVRIAWSDPPGDADRGALKAVLGGAP